MASDPNAPRSRRALLAAAAGAAGAVAASAAVPAGIAAADPNDVVKEIDNATVATTSITQSAAGAVAFKARTTNTDAAGLLGSTGDETDISSDTSFTGVYGWSPSDSTNFAGSGVWGDSPDNGVVGTGTVGVLGIGGIGVWASGSGAPGLIGESDNAAFAGVLARGSSSTGLALSVIGKTKFSRSGRSSIGSGRSSLTVPLSGVTSTSKVFAVLHSNRSGRYVRAVVPTTNRFTIYLNASVTSASFIAWFVLD